MRKLSIPSSFSAMQAKDFSVLWSNGNAWCREAERQLAIHGIIARIVSFPPIWRDGREHEPLLLVNYGTYRGVDEIRYYCECVEKHPELVGCNIGYSVPEPADVHRRHSWEPAWEPWGK